MNEVLYLRSSLDIPIDLAQSYWSTTLQVQVPANLEYCIYNVIEFSAHDAFLE